MKRTLFIGAFLLLAGTLTFGQNQRATELKLIEMDKAWTAAELKGDTATAGMYVSDDFWETTPDGVFRDKKGYLADLKPTTDKDVADRYNVRFLSPDIAIMTHRGTVSGKEPGEYRSTHIWMNRGGKWVIVAHHSSNIKADTAAAEASPKAASM